MEKLAEFGKVVLDKLGNLAPLIIIAVLAAFGIRELRDQDARNYERLSSTATVERELARKEFETANSALKDS